MFARTDLLPSLRTWQKDAFAEYFRLPRRDFLLVATPGAGKTAYALTIAAELLARRAGGAPPRHPAGSGLPQRAGPRVGRLHRGRGDLRAGGGPPGPAQAAHGEP